MKNFIDLSPMKNGFVHDYKIALLPFLTTFDTNFDITF